MGTVLFVHGTGVREAQFAVTFEAIQRGLGKVKPGVAVRPCFWGREFGAQVRGESIPDYPRESEVSDSARAQALEEAGWAMLELDPLYELRVLGVRAPPGRHLPPGHPGELLHHDTVALATDTELFDVVSACGLGDHWLPALDAISESPEFDRAVWFAEDDAIRERRAVARALVAWAQLQSFERDGYSLGYSERDELVAATLRSLDADIAGVISDVLTWTRQAFLGTAGAAVAPAATWFAARKRAAISDATTPAAGDILVYQARGDDIRRYIKSAIADIDDDVTVLAHSLGGIASVDLLASDDIAQVTTLITVGSQAPFLHEIGALWSLDENDVLPPHFPRWLNIYDRKDFLSFTGSKVFSGRVSDHGVDNRCSFPRSHSAYWTNPQVWDQIEGWLR